MMNNNKQKMMSKKRAAVQILGWTLILLDKYTKLVI
jgi:hypothetical protein